MKILVLNGSPRRNGHTARLLDVVVGAATDAAKGAGGAGGAKPETEVRTYILNELAFKGCQGCLECKKETAKRCEQADELAPVLDYMKEADTWVIGTPIYMGHVSGQLKLFFDRVYGFTGPNRANRLPPGKKAVIAVTQGTQDPDTYKNVVELVSYMLSRRGISIRSVVAGGSSSAVPGSTFSKEVEDRARAAGAWLAQAG